MEHAIQCAVKTIREKYSEPLTLDELSSCAMVSKFHFLRTFRRITGVTPGRFLSAVRIHEAKILLLTTSLNVSDIGAQVGYGSTGSFTRRFSASVGCSPTQYRNSSPGGEPPAAAPRMSLVAGDAGTRTEGTVSGRVEGPDVTGSGIYIGVFESPILEGPPAAHTALARPGGFHIGRVPPGDWYIHAMAQSARPGDMTAPARPLLSGSAGPVAVGPGADLGVRVTLRPLNWANPPILFSPVEWSAHAS
ncbi:helix-turn-helix domain-containing protein [Streptomyces iconiensis]|uniref:AraC family transcriptional regulator n=1 Tax=Streptomyces iconiensis TaxID=1384038 RepID=A0ABT6ZX90_9ACTN|nr:AraC family transcriptional regulator [Streptomyces iconiensis]MDJ1133685.1 AraC family transcriptional regulator [Streptomyces iconiensis]